MSGPGSRLIALSVKVYVAAVLIIAAILSPLMLSFVPLLLLVIYLSLWRWRISAVMNLLTEYFMFFAIALLMTPIGAMFSWLVSLPVLFLINRSLEEAAEELTYRESSYARIPTSISVALSLIAILVLSVAVLVGNLSLLLACAVILSYFGALWAIVLRRMPLKPMEETRVAQRMVAGSDGNLQIILTTRTDVGGLLFVESPYEWLKVSPGILTMKEKRLSIRVSLSPSLSGPSSIKLKAHAFDRWGLVQTRFELEPISLYVIPRARYAAWLARRYLAETRPGSLPLISNIGARKPLYGLRRGIEYYGSKLYQPGDSLKDIDWKHSLTHRELVVKEFAEFHGQSAIVLINLAAANEEEADKLAYKIIVTAISLAQENIPAALAAYDQESVKLTTRALHARELVLQALGVAREIVTFANPAKYLSPPDVTRLRANISRIRFAQSEASKVLTQLMQLEYKNFERNARINPATRALAEVFAKADKQSNIVVISHRNHDAEALAFNEFSLVRKGNPVINI